MLRASLRVISFGIALCWLVALVACAATEQVTEEEGISIVDIMSHQAEYEGKTVTRSNWILKDETGDIYANGNVLPGLDPVEDIDNKITAYGTVRVKDDQSYIEAEIAG